MKASVVLEALQLKKIKYICKGVIFTRKKEGGNYIAYYATAAPSDKARIHASKSSVNLLIINVTIVINAMYIYPLPK